MVRNVERDSSVKSKTGVIPFAVMQQYSGLEVLRQGKDGQLPLPAIRDVITFDLWDMEFGRANIITTPDERFYNTIGLVHGGYAMTLFGNCIGGGIYTTL